MKTAARALLVASMIGAAAAGYFGYRALAPAPEPLRRARVAADVKPAAPAEAPTAEPARRPIPEVRSEEHTSELQSPI